MVTNPIIGKKPTISLLWALLMISLELEYGDESKRVNPCNKPEFYIVEIGQINKTLSDIAVIEKKLRTSKGSAVTEYQKELGELVKANPFKPEGYLRIWTMCYQKKKYDQIGRAHV